jgi:hypothetical protein
MIQTERNYKAMIHYEHFPGLRDITIYSVSKSTLSRWVRAADANRMQTDQDHQITPVWCHGYQVS